MRPQFFLSLLLISTLVSHAQADIALDEFFNRASLLKSPDELAAIAKTNIEKVSEQQSRYTVAGCAVDVVFADNKAQQLKLAITDNCQPDINVLQQLDNPFDHKTPLSLKKFAEHAGDPIFYGNRKYPNTLFSYVAGSSAGDKAATDPASASLLAISEFNASNKSIGKFSCDTKSSAKYLDAFGKLPVKQLILGWNIQPVCHQF